LGSKVCTPRSPACNECPVIALCAAHRKDLVTKIPGRAKTKRYEDVTEIAVVIRRGNKVLLRQCQAGERWAGLWDFPRFAAAGECNGQFSPQIAASVHDLVGLSVVSRSRLATMKHGVTRFRITLHAYEAAEVSPRGSSPKRGNSRTRWVKIGELPDYPLSVTGRKISRLLAVRSLRVNAELRLFNSEIVDISHAD
jgi:A/G-specific adenine glycosylase